MILLLKILNVVKMMIHYFLVRFCLLDHQKVSVTTKHGITRVLEFASLVFTKVLVQ